mmetsp:Transcript_88747/g.255964  ORF Transcript_88747/g.255964 Transcript_88747/m.255964 type:complete len:309 (+) Transcript_88747:1212-2138(+)
MRPHLLAGLPRHVDAPVREPVRDESRRRELPPVDVLAMVIRVALLTLAQDHLRGADRTRVELLDCAEPVVFVAQPLARELPLVPGSRLVVLALAEVQKAAGAGRQAGRRRLHVHAHAADLVDEEARVGQVPHLVGERALVHLHLVVDALARLAVSQEALRGVVPLLIGVGLVELARPLRDPRLAGRLVAVDALAAELAHNETVGMEAPLLILAVRGVGQLAVVHDHLLAVRRGHRALHVKAQLVAFVPQIAALGMVREEMLHLFRLAPRDLHEAVVKEPGLAHVAREVRASGEEFGLRPTEGVPPHRD